MTIRLFNNYSYSEILIRIQLYVSNIHFKITIMTSLSHQCVQYVRNGFTMLDHPQVILFKDYNNVIRNIYLLHTNSRIFGKLSLQNI